MLAGTRLHELRDMLAALPRLFESEAAVLADDLADARSELTGAPSCCCRLVWIDPADHNLYRGRWRRRLVARAWRRETSS